MAPTIRNRRIPLAVVIALIASTTLAAQDVPLSLGTKAGANVGSYAGSAWDDLISDMDRTHGEFFATGSLWAVGFNVSAFLELRLTPNLAVQPQLGVAMRSGGFGEEGQFRDPASGSPTEVSTRALDSFGMLDLPIYLKPRGEAGRFSFYALLGPHFALVMGRGYSARIEDGQVVPERSGSFKVDNRFLAGIGAGTGMAVDVGVGSIMLDLTAFRSFNSPFDDIERTNAEIAGPRLRSFDVSTGFALPLSR